ncbi:MAG: glycosyltransferase family 9 protein [Planctomycetes bacterium]|nr:glycosyltransferase family 9 protein [Planctomycetota bacterium]
MLHAPRRILIVRLSHLGDVVHGLPVLRALRRAHPRARIGWVVQPEFADILAGHPDLDEVILFERRAGFAAWVRLERELTRFGADWTVDAQGNTKSALVALSARAPRRSGMARADWREPFAASTLTDSAPAAARSADGSVHAVDRMLALARHVAPDIDVADLASNLWPTPVASARDLFAHTDRERYAILHLAGAEDVRSWPATSFAELARDLARDHEVVIVSGPLEREAGLRLAQELHALQGLQHWPGQTGLGELRAAFQSAALKHAVFVGCDSGPLHVAWAAGMRVVLLAGPQDSRRTGPWPPPERDGPDARHRIVRATNSPECAPCLARRCTHPAGNVCMQRIEPGTVARAVRALTVKSPTVFATAP